MHGDGAEAGQLASLKGQMQALDTTSAQKGCGIVIAVARYLGEY
jgi:hypothetical protein